MMIRRADRQDIDALCRLLRQVQNVHAEGRPDLFKAGGQKYTVSELTLLLADDSRPVFVYVDGDNLLGYAFCVVQHTAESGSQWERKNLYIDDLCVEESCRGRHIGTALYDHVTAFAKENGFDSITLNVWSLNKNAEKFYEKMGLKPLKTTMETLLK